MLIFVLLYSQNLWRLPNAHFSLGTPAGLRQSPHQLRRASDSGNESGHPVVASEHDCLLLSSRVQVTVMRTFHLWLLAFLAKRELPKTKADLVVIDGEIQKILELMGREQLLPTEATVTLRRLRNRKIPLEERRDALVLILRADKPPDH